MFPYSDSIKYINLNIDSSDFYDICFENWIYPSKLTELIDKGYNEVWILKQENKDGQIIAIAKNGKLELYSEFVQELIIIGGSQNSFNKAFLPIILDVDIILEKISKYGIHSITDEEKNYLDEIYQ